MADKSMVRISVVSYLNSKPFIYGLRNAKFNTAVEITEDIPSVCAEKLMNGKADVGLVPVIILPLLTNPNIISDYCIGADGEVGSVLLFSEVPINEIKSVLLDYQSRTSVMLTKVLARNHWRITPEWKETSSEYENNISGDTAGVVIGDRALLLKNKFPYVYDLAEEWKKLTGFPFVFACWVSINKLDKIFISEFNKAMENGMNKIDEIAENESSLQLSKDEIKKYLTHRIDYNFDSKKREALELFLKMAETADAVDKKQSVNLSTKDHRCH
jgi:chorismate dehydratase